MLEWSDDAFAGYLAAMIDGEGHIEIIAACSVRIRIANTVLHTLQAIRDRLGYGRVIEYARPPSRGYKRLFCYEVSSAVEIRKLLDLCGRFIHMKPGQMAAALAIVDRVLAESKRLDARNRAILAAIHEGKVQNQIARDFGVSPQLVSRIKSGHKWSSVISGHRARNLAKTFPRGADQSIRLHGEPNDGGELHALDRSPHSDGGGIRHDPYRSRGGVMARPAHQRNDEGEKL